MNRKEASAVSKVYAVAGAKGGVGKTTTSVNLGAAVARAGYSAVTVELDLGMANLVDFLDVDVDVGEATTLHDVLRGEADAEAACYAVDDGFQMAISGTDLSGYADTDLSRLPSVVETFRSEYDLVLLDTPAGLSEETVRPLQVADGVLLVSTPRVASIRNARNTLELADRVDAEPCGLVLTKSGTGASPGADRIAEFLGLDLLGHVPEDDAIPHSQDRGVTVGEYAPNSGAAVAYRKIGRKVVDAAIPEAETETPDSRPVERGSTTAVNRGAAGSERRRASERADGPWVTPRSEAADGTARDERSGSGAVDDGGEEAPGDPDETPPGGDEAATEGAVEEAAAASTTSPDTPASSDDPPSTAGGPDSDPDRGAVSGAPAAGSGELTRGGSDRERQDAPGSEGGGNGSGPPTEDGASDDGPGVEAGVDRPAVDDEDRADEPNRPDEEGRPDDAGGRPDEANRPDDEMDREREDGDATSEPPGAGGDDVPESAPNAERSVGARIRSFLGL